MCLCCYIMCNITWLYHTFLYNYVCIDCNLMIVGVVTETFRSRIIIIC